MQNECTIPMYIAARVVVLKGVNFILLARVKRRITFKTLNKTLLWLINQVDIMGMYDTP